jgi:hypothetical protein
VENVKAVGLHQFAQFKKGPEAEGLDFGENPTTGGGKFIESKRGENFEGVVRGKIIIFLPEEVVIGDRMERHSLQEKRPRRADDDMYFVAQFDKFVGEVGEVNSLSATIGISAITEQSDLQTLLLKKI